MRAILSKRTRGMTVVELIVAVGLTTVVLTGAGSAYTAVQRCFIDNSRKLVAQREATQLSTLIAREIRVATSGMIYEVPERDTPVEAGNGLALYDRAGTLVARLEWSEELRTLVDDDGAQICSHPLAAIQFAHHTTQPRIVQYSFSVDDERGNLVDVAGAAGFRN